MSVPTYDWWYLPLLRLLNDGEVHRMADVYEQLADEAGLSEADRAEMLPSGQMYTYVSRIGWARTYLKAADLVALPSRGHVQITQRGMAVLSEAMTRKFDHIDNAWLEERCPQFAEWRAKSRSQRNTLVSQPATCEREFRSSETPRDVLERAQAELRRTLADELLERVKQVNPLLFEKIVVDLMLAMGYGGSREDAGRSVGGPGDAGIDGVIDEDRLGLDKVYLQAKRWEGSVGRPIVQSFSGAMAGVHAMKGVLVTTSTFTSDTRQFVRDIGQKIVLVDGQQLAQLMIEHGVGVSVETTYELKRVDGDYFEPD